MRDVALGAANIGANNGHQGSTSTFIHARPGSITCEIHEVYLSTD